MPPVLIQCQVHSDTITTSKLGQGAAVADGWCFEKKTGDSRALRRRGKKKKNIQKATMASLNRKQERKWFKLSTICYPNIAFDSPASGIAIDRTGKWPGGIRHQNSIFLFKNHDENTMESSDVWLSIVIKQLTSIEQNRTNHLSSTVSSTFGNFNPWS